VERNRLFLTVKNFPVRELVLAPFVALARYGWHAVYLLAGRGKAAEHGTGGGGAVRLAWYVVKAHLALARAWPRLCRERGVIARGRHIGPGEFRGLLKRHAISVKRVAEQ
jgi:hypothetical protein